jgi:O-antigen/teichoic acid export membrane protein
LAAEQDNLDKSVYLFFRSIALVAVYATPFYVGLLWTAEPLVVGLYGEKWRAAAIPLAILAFAWPFWLLENLAGSVLAARNWLHRELAVQVSSLLVMALLVVIGLSWGLAGVAVAIVGASAFTAAYMQWLAVQCLRTTWRHYLAALLPAVVLNVPLAAFLYALDHLLVGRFASGAYTYLVVMVMGGGAFYAVLFLALPLRALDAERERWWARAKGLRRGRFI